MYRVSEEFHKAVFERSPASRVLFRFPDDTIFTNEDIVGSRGLSYNAAVNSEIELTIGSCPAAELSATVFNRDGLLSNFAYGECTVSLGVRVSSIESAHTGVTAIFRYGDPNQIIFSGSRRPPYFRANGTAPTIQPPFPVYSIVIVGAIIYCIGVNGEAWACAWRDGYTFDWLATKTFDWIEANATIWDDIQGVLVPVSSVTTFDVLAKSTFDEVEAASTIWDDFLKLVEMSTFMRDKLKRWAAAGRGMWMNDNILYEFGETIDKFEYVPLGIFRVEEPTKRRTSQIEMVSLDRMTKFDIDAAPFLDSLVYPITLGGIYAGLCTYVGVKQATLTFINSNRVFSEPPAGVTGMTCREVYRWIAEAAGAYGKITRDGEAALVWFGTHNISLPMDQYFSIEPAEYEVMPIDKLQVMNATTDIGVIIGTGVNAYQIMDNPYLYGATDTEIRTYAAPIYNRLVAFKAFSPIIARAVCDWSIDAGDVISIEFNGISYSLPIYRQSITWNNAARVTYESTGSRSRPVVSAVNRQLFEQRRAMHEFELSVDGIKSNLTDAEGKIASLEFTTGGLNLAIQNNRLTFNTSGLTTYNAQGQRTLWQDPTTGGLYISGTLQGAGGTFAGALVAATGTFSGSLSAATGTFSGALQAATGTFSGNLSAAGGTFSGDLTAAGGTFHGTLQAANGTFGGSLTAATGTFSGNLSAAGGTFSGNLSAAGGTFTGALLAATGTFSGALQAATGTFSGALSAASGTFTDLTGTGRIVLGKMTLDQQGVWLSGATDETRILMNPPTMTAGSGSDARWIYRSDYGTYSLGITTSSLKYKKNFEDIGIEAVGVIDRLKPILYNYIDDDDSTIKTPGFGVEPTYKVCKELTESIDGVPRDVRHKSVPAYLVADAQITHKRLDEYEQRIAAIERGAKCQIQQ